jgi:HEAT repeat protein
MNRPKVSSRVLKNLSSPDVSKRRSAAEALADGDERAIYPLIRALRDKHPGVQDAATRSLIAIGGEVTAWMVLPLLREEAFFRNTAMVILKEIGAAAVHHLPPLLRDKDDDVRKFAIELISDGGGREYADRLVERLACDPNPNVRGAAAKALGELDCREAVPQLVAALKDIEWVRFTVLESLRRLGDEGVLDPILELLSDPSAATRRAAIETLGAIGSPRAGDALLAYLAKADVCDRPSVLMSLLRIGVPLPGDGFPRDLLGIFLDGDSEWEDRVIALRGLIGIADRDALHAIFDTTGSLDATEPNDEEILRSIKELLLRCGHPEHLPALLDDPTLRFRGKTILAEVAGELRIREAVPALVARLRDDVRDVRRAAASALGKINDDEALEGLLESIRDNDGHVRKAVVLALGALGRKEAFGPLLALLREETYGDVAEEIVRALDAVDRESLSAASGDFDDRAKGIYEAFVRGALGAAGTEGPADEIWK